MSAKLRARLVLLASLAGLGVALSLGARSTLVESVELKTYDWRFRAFADPSRRDPRVVLLLLDQQSLDHFEKDGIYWPWPRSIYEAVLGFCKKAGAKAVVFDALFTSPSPYGPAEDAAFAKALKAHGNAVLARTGAREPIPTLKAAARALGDVSALPDFDGVFRRVPLRNADGALTLPAAAAVAVTGTTATLAGVPLEDGKMLVRFRGARPYPAYPLGRVIQAWQNLEERKDPGFSPSELSGKLVLIGYSAPGLMDLRPSPVSNVSPGTEIVAAAADGLLTGDAMRRLPRAGSIALILLALTLGALAALVAESAWAAVAASAALFGAAILAFRSGLWLDLAAPQLSLWLGFAASAAYGYAVEGRQRRHIHKAFATYLAPEVVDQIAEDPETLALGGQRRELTCYFSDIEGFTTISESLTPERLTYLMNRYLGVMTDTILESKGTLDKYIGDAIMAFWGAPMPRADHALVGCKAALENQRRLVGLSKELEAEGFPPIRARIGLNSGPASVGNMGSPRRFSYTALGDTINLASRLEGANKVYGSYILISETTRREAGDAIEVRELDRIKVKGKTEPVTVYELLGLKGQVDSQRLEDARRWEAALSLYKVRKFKEARAAFAALWEHEARELYIMRCDEFTSEPPPPDWDGSFALKEK